MDLSGLKWPLIILIILGIGWLFSSGGINYMIKNFTKAEVGADPKRDVIDENGLSRLGGWMLLMWRYDKAMQVLQLAVDRYPDGRNVWYNRYRMVKCAEKLQQYALATTIMEELIGADASSKDPRVPPNDNLRLRSEKLIEMYEIKKR